MASSKEEGTGTDLEKARPAALTDAGVRSAATTAPDAAPDLTPAAQELESTPVSRTPIIRSGNGMANSPLLGELTLVG
jgi:hypothetical protein